MLITAIVNNHGNTLVVDLPRDRMDLDNKLYSIGEEISHRIPISDNPDSDVRTQLLADSDIGLHLINLFSDRHTLKDVNDVCQTVMNAPDEVKEVIESDILYDQYSSPQELIDDIKKQTYESGEYTETFYFPLLGRLDDEEYGDEYEVDNSFLRSYEWDIRELVERE